MAISLSLADACCCCCGGSKVISGVGGSTEGSSAAAGGRAVIVGFGSPLSKLSAGVLVTPGLNEDVVDDVDLVPGREDVRSHLRIPVASTLAEVDARFNEFLDEGCHGDEAFLPDDATWGGDGPGKGTAAEIAATPTNGSGGGSSWFEDRAIVRGRLIETKEGSEAGSEPRDATGTPGASIPGGRHDFLAGSSGRN